ncbi:hypothetical protein JMJ77_0009287, partial [Colletotrichum scovillei]
MGCKNQRAGPTRLLSTSQCHLIVNEGPLRTAFAASRLDLPISWQAPVSPCGTQYAYSVRQVL